MTNWRGTSSESVGRSILLGILLTAANCTTPPGVDAGDAASDAGRPDAPPMFAGGSCATAGEAPLRAGDGGFTCTPVGADRIPAAAMWPDVATEIMPIAYVAAGATGGTGTMAQPFGDVGAALRATPAPRTIVLSRGTFMVAAALDIARDVTVIGTGSVPGDMGSNLQIAAGVNAFSIQGASTHVSLRGVGIRYPAPTEPCSPMGFGVQGTMGASVTLDNVEIDGAGTGVRMDTGTLSALRVSLLHTCERAIFLRADARATLRSVLILDGSGVGVLAQDSSVDFERGLIRGQGRDGVALLGGIPLADHAVRSVAMIHDGVTGLRVEQSAAGRAANLEAGLLSISDTQGPRDDGGVGGDGIYVGPGATVSLDRAIMGDEHRGEGSEIIGNSRSGILVGGMGTAVGHLSLSAGLVASNRGPGLYVQDGALLDRVAYSRVIDNRALGLGVTTQGQLNLMLCNEIAATHTGTIVTVGAGSLELGDGVSMAESMVGAPASRIAGNVFQDNDRFALVITGGSATLQMNTGGNNLYGVAGYTATLSMDGTNTVTGRSATPTDPGGIQFARGQLLESH